MFNFINKFQSSQKIYSYGKIISIKESVYILEYKGSFVKVYSKDLYYVGDWLIFYGNIDGDTINAEYLENISGVDCTIMEKFIDFLNNNIVN
ncbi:protein TEN1 [Vairimorpha necatrix]|uniref:Protein TEN1 n=1 Tax=Vairimorpha necatrix TaxID=6039 RepID=A0AAX4JDA9_9MICR